MPATAPAPAVPAPDAAGVVAAPSGSGPQSPAGYGRVVLISGSPHRSPIVPLVTACRVSEQHRECLTVHPTDSEDLLPDATVRTPTDSVGLM